MRRETKFKVFTVVIGLLVAALLGEVSLRLFFKQRLGFTEDERSLSYRYDADLGWFPKSNSQNVITGSRPITATHNSDGFRDHEFVTSTNPAIVFIGDSFVWGYDVEAPERFTDLLQLKHPEWKIYNCGISGYGNDQEYLLLQKIFDRFKPRVVFLMYCTENDYQENAYSFAYGYYKPYFTTAPDGSNLTAQGTPVPRGERVFWTEHKQFRDIYLVRLFVRIYFNLTCPEPVHLGMRDGRNENPTAPLLVAMNDYVRSKGAAFVVGITQTNVAMQGFLQGHQIPFVDVSTPLRYPTHWNHWTPEGHAFVRDKVEQALQGVLKQ